MTAFTSDKPNTLKRVISDLLFIPAILVLMFWITRMLNIKQLNGYFYLAAGSFAVLINMYKLFSKTVYKLIFDPAENNLRVIFKSIISGETEKSVSLTGLRMEIDESKPIIPVFRKEMALYVLKDKTELFEINSTSDGFKTSTLLDIKAAAESCSIPLTAV